MKKRIFKTSGICALLLSIVCCSCNAPFVEDTVEEEAAYPVEFRLQTAPTEGNDMTEKVTRATGDLLHDVNLYACNDHGITRHLYGLPSGVPPMTLPAGTYRIYAIGNAGTDLGEMDETALLGLRTPQTGITEFDGEQGMYMAGKQTVNVAGPTKVELTLKRLAAKISAKIRIDDALKDACLVHFIPVCAPSDCSVFAENRLKSKDDPCLSLPYIDFSLVGLREFSPEYYQYENMQGINSAITDPRDRFDGKAPAWASCLAIRIRYKGVYYDYNVYLGGNTTSDFNIRRNTCYHYDITIMGTNPNDLRVSKTEITFWAGGKEMAINYNYYYNGFYWLARSAFSELVITTENCDPNTQYTVSFKPIAGTFKSDWKMQYLIDPESPLPQSYKTILPEEKLTVHRGNGTSRIKFQFSNYEGIQNYNTGDNDFDFEIRTSEGIGPTITVSTNQNKWKK